MAGQGDLRPKKKTDTEKVGQPWVDLMPTDVLRSVALRLPPPDLSSFQKVCKAWRSLPIESYPLGQSPLFLFKDDFFFEDDFNGDSDEDEKLEDDFDEDEKLDEKIYMYSPLYNMTFSWAVSQEVLDIFRSNESYMRYSKDGWVVFYEFSYEPDHRTIVFVNPFLPSTAASATVIRWRMPTECPEFPVVSMSAPPTDPACILLLMNNRNYGIHVFVGSKGGTNWKADFFEHEGPDEGPDRYISSCVTSPVFRGGVFYFLMISGCLVVYDPHRRTWDEHHSGIAMNPQNALVEWDGELFNVYNCRDDYDSCKCPVDPLVYKLNESSMKWEESTELGGRALYLDRRSAISAMPEVDGMKDRIFSHAFHDIAEKVDCGLHRSADGEPRLVPRPNVGYAKLARRAVGKLVGISSPYPSCYTLRSQVTEACGIWVQPKWRQ